MVVRVVRFRVAAAFAHAATEAARTEIFGARRPPGLVRATFGRQESGAGWVTFVTVSEWTDMASIYAWMGGPELQVVALPAGWTAPTETLDVQHYVVALSDSVGGEPTDLSGSDPVVSPAT